MGKFPKMIKNLKKKGENNEKSINVEKPKNLNYLIYNI